MLVQELNTEKVPNWIGIYELRLNICPPFRPLFCNKLLKFLPYPSQPAYAGILLTSSVMQGRIWPVFPRIR